MIDTLPLRGITFTATDIPALWSVQASRNIPLGDFTNAVFGASTRQNDSLLVGSARQWLRAWPHQAYLLTGQPELPAEAEPFAALMTDIADAFCAFNLQGEAAFEFIAHYLSADIRQTATGRHCLRCRLGDYVVLLWWQDRGRLQLLIERSMAQSFADYLERLMARHYPAAL